MGNEGYLRRASEDHEHPLVVSPSFSSPFSPSSSSFLFPSSLASSKGRHGLAKEDGMEGEAASMGRACYSAAVRRWHCSTEYCSNPRVFPLLLLLVAAFLMGRGPLGLNSPLMAGHHLPPLGQIPMGLRPRPRLSKFRCKPPL